MLCVVSRHISGSTATTTPVAAATLASGATSLPIRSPQAERNPDLEPERVPARFVLDPCIALILEGEATVGAEPEAKFRADRKITPAQSTANNGPILSIIGGLLVKVTVQAERNPPGHFLHGYVFPRKLVSAVVASSDVLGIDDVLQFRADFGFPLEGQIRERPDRCNRKIMLPHIENGGLRIRGAGK